jgi:hypothetical protein
MKRNQVFASLCLALIVFLAVSCSKPDSKSANKKEKSKAAADAQQGGSVKVAEPTIQDILSSVPCKLEAKLGGFALFPSNATPGQWCFSLAAGDPSLGVTSFDIQTNDMFVVFHDNAPRAQGTVALMSASLRGDGSPCLDADCLKPVPVSLKTSPDKDNPAWSWLLLTPQAPVDLTTGAGGVFVITVDGVVQYPVFK